MPVVEHPVEVELDRRRVQRRAVVKGDAVTQGEGVGPAGIGDRPSLGQRRLGLQAASPIAHQPVIDVHQDAEVVQRRDRVWIERRSEEHTSELQSLMRISYAVFCLKKKKSKYTSAIDQKQNHIYITKQRIYD